MSSARHLSSSGSVYGRLAAFALLSVTTLPAGFGQCHTQEFIASDANALDKFGDALAIDGDIAIVAARLADTAATNGGAAYVFERTASGWVQVQVLIPSDPGAQDMFGWAVDLEGDMAVVSAPRNDDAGENSGAAYVFENTGSTWVETAKLRASDEGPVAKFGKSVFLSGGRLIVGAPGTTGAAVSSGAAYIFEHDGTTWSEIARLEASDAAANDSFGQALAISGFIAVVGAPRDEDFGTSTGSAYVFELIGTSWVETAKLLASDAGALAAFGSTVTAKDETLIIGAMFAPVLGEPLGAAYVFERTGTVWVETQQIRASTGFGFQEFGGSLALYFDRLLVGAPAVSFPGGTSGSVYVFEREASGWVETRELQPVVPMASDIFGWAVSISGDDVLVGTPQSVQSGSPPGVVHAFDLDGPDCDLNGIADCEDIAAEPSLDSDGNGLIDSCECAIELYCKSVVNSTGLPAAIGATGSFSLAQNDLTLTVSGLPLQQFGIFFYGMHQTELPFGDGLLCLSNPIFRLSPVPSGQTGASTFLMDYTQPPEQAAEITTGSTWNFQFWYRDPAAGLGGFNLTAALQISFCP